MLDILLGFLVFCLVLWCVVALAACGILQILLFGASVLTGLGILAFANTGLLTTILGIAFVVIPFGIGSNDLSDN
nr:MAG TPA: hypothetical protein [Caudoviricetes sp.]